MWGAERRPKFSITRSLAYPRRARARAFVRRARRRDGRDAGRCRRQTPLSGECLSTGQIPSCPSAVPYRASQPSLLASAGRLARTLPPGRADAENPCMRVVCFDDERIARDRHPAQRRRSR
jgi:hypothetical protein